MRRRDVLRGLTGTYVEDYRRLTGLAAGLGVKGILIWGFLRESHGGIDFAKRVADEAAARGTGASSARSRKDASGRTAPAWRA